MPAYRCRICDCVSRAAEFFAVASMFRCGACGCVQACKLPSAQSLRAYYARLVGDYTAGMGPVRFVREMPKRHSAKLRTVKAIIASGRLLDIGCAEGSFLEQAVRAGLEGQGCDYALRSNYPEGVRVTTGCVDRWNGLPFEDGAFDVVTLFAVIEHVREPQVAVREIARVLRKGGYFFCETPLCGDLSERLAAARSHWFCPPEHLHVFSRKGLRLLCERAGYEVIRHWSSFERNRARWLARRLRNLLIGALMGGVTKAIAPGLWWSKRPSLTTQIGDIQLLVARRL
jgi:SAM-dependent methyltransferase